MAINLLHLLGYGEDADLCGGFYILGIAISFVSLSFGCAVAIVFLGVDVWRAFSQRKHWIPGDALVLGALALQLLVLLKKPSFDFSVEYQYTDIFPLDDACVYLNVISHNWMLVLPGRVSTCVLMGCLLPGVARPLSTTLWSDMAALIISFSLALLDNVAYEISLFPRAYLISLGSRTCGIHFFTFIFIESWNIVIFLSMVTLILLLGSAALASISIHETVSRKVPVVLSTLKFSPHLSAQVLSKSVEEQVLKSWIAVRTSNPQYIIARSVLTSSIGLIIAVCNGILLFETARCSKSRNDQIISDAISRWFHQWHHRCEKKWLQDVDCGPNPPICYEGCIPATISIPLILHYVVIVIGSSVIYWRSITAVAYNPKMAKWQWSSVRKEFQIEDFWKRYLLELISGSKRHRREEIGESYFKRLVIKFLRSIRFHKLLPLLFWLQMFLVVLSKGCWLLLQVLLSNVYVRKLVMRSAYQEFSFILERQLSSQVQLGEGSEYDKYSKAVVCMQGENPAGLWIANKTSIQEIMKRMREGEEEGKGCREFIAFLVNKSSLDFTGQTGAKPQNCRLVGLEVERKLDVSKRSCKMTSVTILTVIIELSLFTNDNKVVDEAKKACSQAWNIMDVVDQSDREAVVMSRAADRLFQNLLNTGRWLHQRLPISVSPDMSPEAVKAAIENLGEKGKEIANAYESRPWNEVAAGYNLYRLCEGIANKCDFNNVQGILDELVGQLAGVMGSCTAKAAEVIAENCKKWVSNFEEERIWRAAGIAGKVKGITESTGWNLKWNASETANAEDRKQICVLKKYATFQMGDSY